MALPETIVASGDCQRNFEALGELIMWGNGDPEGVVVAKIEAVFHRLDGGTAGYVSVQVRSV